MGMVMFASPATAQQWGLSQQVPDPNGSPPGVAMDYTGTTAVLLDGRVLVRDGVGNWTQQAQLGVSPTAGIAAHVALWGDTVVFCGLNPSDTTQGAAYVFTRSGATWSFEQMLTPSDPTPADGFCSTVAISWGQIVVGDAARGKAYVFTDASASWNEVQQLFGTVNYFGQSIALANEVLIVGDSGQVFVYVSPFGGETYSLQQTIVASNGDPAFGIPVAIDGYYATTAAVGAGTSFYIESRATGSELWTEGQHVLGSGDNFPLNLAVSSDTIVALDKGIASGLYVYELSAATWIQEQILPWNKRPFSYAVGGDAATVILAGDPSSAKVDVFYPTSGTLTPWPYGGSGPYAPAVYATPTTYTVSGSTVEYNPDPVIFSAVDPTSLTEVSATAPSSAGPYTVCIPLPAVPPASVSVWQCQQNSNRKACPQAGADSRLVVPTADPGGGPWCCGNITGGAQPSNQMCVTTHYATDLFIVGPVSTTTHTVPASGRYLPWLALVLLFVGSRGARLSRRSWAPLP
jgi:hypothetical protein